METKICGRCGKELSSGDDDYCSECKGYVVRRKKSLRMFSAVAVVILLLAGLVMWHGEINSWEFSWDALLRRPVAVINGEPVSRSAAMERLNISRIMMEREYGKDIFAGERGRALLANLDRDILGKMVEEQLIAQEARRLNVIVSEDRVKQELQNIAREIYGTWENFQSSLREDGISPEYLSNHIRNLILLQELKKAKTPPGVNPDASFAAWIVKAKQDARITMNRSIEPTQASFAISRAGCCGLSVGGGGGCGTSQGATGPVDPELRSKASAAALDAYRRTSPVEKDVQAEVKDYGCHIQVDIEKGGKVIKSYAYQDGMVFDN